MTRVAAALALAAVPASASADPLRLRADAFATTASPAGLVTLSADGSPGPGLSAEAVVWTGGAPPPGAGAVGDVLVMALRARTRDGRAQATLGRFVESLGALRPVHVDGGATRLALPRRFVVETFAGVPVQPDLTVSRAWDWVVGGRASRRLGDYGSLGVAYLEQRDDGRLDTEEVGVDAGASLGKHDDAAAKVAYDLVNPGVAEVGVSASDRRGDVRGELYASYRAASHILPATSLFSVLGDTPAERAGATLSWRAAPRLDVGGDVGARYAAGDAAPEVVLRAKLRLDDRGASALSGELRRDGVGSDEWTGARAAARIALPDRVALSTEVELVVPDHDRGTGAVWPWGLVALSWATGPWSVAVAVEASASPEDIRRIDGLATIGRSWELGK